MHRDFLLGYLLRRTLLPDHAARNHRLRSIVVELHREGKHQTVEVAVQRREVEAEHVARRLNRIGLLFGL